MHVERVTEDWHLMVGRCVPKCQNVVRVKTLNVAGR